MGWGRMNSVKNNRRVMAHARATIFVFAAVMAGLSGMRGDAATDGDSRAPYDTDRDGHGFRSCFKTLPR